MREEGDQRCCHGVGESVTILAAHRPPFHTSFDMVYMSEGTWVGSLDLVLRIIDVVYSAISRR